MSTEKIKSGFCAKSSQCLVERSTYQRLQQCPVEFQEFRLTALLCSSLPSSLSTCQSISNEQWVTKCGNPDRSSSNLKYLINSVCYKKTLETLGYKEVRRKNDVVKESSHVVSAQWQCALISILPLDFLVNPVFPAAKMELLMPMTPTKSPRNSGVDLPSNVESLRYTSPHNFDNSTHDLEVARKHIAQKWK